MLLIGAFALAQDAPAEAAGGALIEGDSLYALFNAKVKSGDAAAMIEGRGMTESFGLYTTSYGGICLGVEGGRIESIYLRSSDHGERTCPGSYTDALPFGLEWGLSPDDVNRRLGQPVEERQGGWDAAVPVNDEPEGAEHSYWVGKGGAYIAAHYVDGGLHCLDIADKEYVPSVVPRWFAANRGTGRLSYVPGQLHEGPSPRETDLDEDGVSDRMDLCPAAPENLNGFKDADGCPDEKIAALLAIEAPAAPPPRVAAAPILAPPIVAAPIARVPPAFPSIDSPARTGAKAPKETAVVIGLEDYPFLGAGVPFAKRDADAFNDMLVYTRGVPMGRIQSLSSGAREQILSAIERSAKEAGSGGTVWVYFAGHGAANPRSGERMLLGDDVRADVTAFATRGVGVAEIEKIVTAAGARPVMILDTCFAGASRSGASILGGTRLVVPGYALSGPSSAGSAQWNAAGPDQISGPLPGVDHGAFTYFAVGALRGWADGELDGERDRTVTAAEAQAYVSRMLRRSGKNEQTPVYVGPDDLVLATGVTETGPER